MMTEGRSKRGARYLVCALLAWLGQSDDVVFADQPSPPPFNALLFASDDGADVFWQSRFGCTHQLQSSTNLTSWGDVGPTRIGDGGVQHTTHPTSAHDTEFFKVRDSCTGEPATAIDVAYPPPPGGDPAMALMDVYYLPDGRPKRLMVFVHGGSWVGGDKSNLASATSLVQWFLERDYVVAAPNFRLASGLGVPREATYADQADDIAHALAWLHDHGAGYGIAKAGVVLMGFSSGAHLVALLAADEHYLADVGRSLNDLAASISLDVHAYDVPYALQLMQGSEVAGNIPLIEHLFGATQADQLAGSPATYAQGAGVPPSLIISAEPSSAPTSKGYIAAQTGHLYAQRLTAWGHQATWVHFDNETHVGLVMDFGAPDDGPTEYVRVLLEGIETE